MKLHNIIKAAMVGMLAFSLSSCEEFLNRPSEDGYNTANFYQNDEQCIQGVNYLYNSPWYDFLRPFLWIGECMSGNIYQGDNKYMEFNVDNTEENLVKMSYSLWSVNGHANTVIYNIQNSEGPSQEIKNQCIGEALTWKAMAYFFMVRTFGEVPIIHDNNEVLTSGTYNEVYKVTRPGIYEYVIMTLEKAMELLPKKGINANGRIDYYSAEALLAKVYLTKAGLGGSLNADDLAKAAEYAKDVIENSGRDLMDEYSDNFRLQHNINREALITWQWRVSTYWTSANAFQNELAMGGFSDFELNGCWGDWTAPSVDLMDAFGVSPDEDPANRSAAVYKDKRRHATMMMPGDTYDYFWTDKGGFDYLKFIYDAEDYGKGGPSGSFNSPTGANCVKHLTGRQADHIAGVGHSAVEQQTSLATHILRFSDVLLIYAEAMMGTAGSTSDASALEAFNRVRRRAGVDEVSGVLTWEQVWKERRLEFAHEGDRWYDYVRRSYYDTPGCIAEIKAQRRGQFFNVGVMAEAYYKSGTWPANSVEYTETDGTPVYTTRYNKDAAIPNVTPESFTLPLPSYDVEFNPNLASAAKDVDVRATYVYNF